MSGIGVGNNCDHLLILINGIVLYGSRTSTDFQLWCDLRAQRQSPPFAARTGSWSPTLDTVIGVRIRVPSLGLEPSRNRYSDTTGVMALGRIDHVSQNGELEGNQLADRVVVDECFC